MELTLKLALCAICIAVINASASIDWENVRPLHIEPKLRQPPPQSREINGRITNGQLASRNQFPYQAGLLLYVQGGAAWCGGSVISDRWILTAAHCTDNLTVGLDAYLGAWDRLDSSEKGQQIIFVQKRNVKVHEAWNPLLLENDISLIKLPVKIQFNEHIQPVELPKKASTYSTYAGDFAIASGWGRISDKAEGATDKLRWVEVPVMKNSACRLWYLGQLKKNNICVKTTGGLSTCNGDSGGPLVLASSKVQIGLTSYGIALGCELGWPGVFTRVTSYLDWIDINTGVVNK